ncbi:MAG TPA: LysM peptidoglycan-binding domain-containing protein [Candidatus Dormibacteraeota bacterium]|nr:LysM peptidoglycan-binding domain-containing protein [Candidatus Dormibacteraeota bacterium]
MIAYDYAPSRRGLRRSRRSLRRDPLLVAAAVACAVLLMMLLGQVVYGGTSVGGQQVQVQSGQTLWSIAAQRYPGDDVRARVDQIVAANHLSGGAVEAGQTLVLPAP